MRDDALQYAKTNQADILGDLQDLLRIPSISTLPSHNDDIERAAQWLVDHLTAIGLDNAKIMPTPGKPVVYADWLHAGPDTPTLLVYGHYDVQPVDPVEEWLTPPFEPTVKDEKLFCRGATDDKGQMYVHIAAVEAYLKSTGKLPLNIKFMLEGEEETGSPNLGPFVEEHQELFKADAAVISDTHMTDPQTPVIVTGVRGLTYMEFTLRGSSQDLHSGMYGGVVENPLNAIAKMLADMRNPDGTIAIPGFYDKVRDLSEAEREIVNDNAITAEEIKKETGAPVVWGDANFTIPERIGTRPTLDVHGIKGGFIDPGSKTVIPAVASAKVSMRLAPDQDCDEIAQLFRDYVQQACPDTMEITVVDLAHAQPAVVDTSAPAIEAAAEAYEICFGNRPIYKREGGTLPIVGMINKVLQAPVVMMGFGLPDDNLHAPNEKFSLGNFYKGIDTAIHFYDILGNQ